MCMFCNPEENPLQPGYTNPDAQNRSDKDWTLSLWHVTDDQSRISDYFHVGLCTTGPHMLPEDQQTANPVQLLGVFAAEVRELFNHTVMVDGRSTTDGYIIGFTGYGEDPQTFDRIHIFCIHPVGTDAMQILDDLTTLHALEEALSQPGTTE